MPWFIVQTERKTWTKYLVKAESEEDVLYKCDDWQYIGYLDGDDQDTTVVGGPFSTESDARNDLVSFVDG